VPIGTEIYKVIKSDPKSNIWNTNTELLDLITDLDEADKEYVVAKGGKGGLGNFKHWEI